MKEPSPKSPLEQFEEDERELRRSQPTDIIESKYKAVNGRIVS